MIPYDPLFDLFEGLSFFDGAEHIPSDLPLSLDAIRGWAMESGLAFDPDQFLNADRIREISRLCSREDRLLIGIAISGESDSLLYLEYPHMSVRSLIRRGEALDLVFWKVSDFDVRFVFQFSGSTEEFCSQSTAARVVLKFAQTLQKLARTYTINSFEDGSKQITVDGDIRAAFVKDGRSFDVELTPKDGA